MGGVDWWSIICFTDKSQCIWTHRHTSKRRLQLTINVIIFMIFWIPFRLSTLVSIKYLYQTVLVHLCVLSSRHCRKKRWSCKPYDKKWVELDEQSTTTHTHRQNRPKIQFIPSKRPTAWNYSRPFLSFSQLGAQRHYFIAEEIHGDLGAGLGPILCA